MRRVQAMRLLGGICAGTLTSCSGLGVSPGWGHADICDPVPAASGNPSTPTLFGCQIYPGDDIAQALTLLSACGSKLVRVLTDGDTQLLDRVFPVAQQNGIRVVAISPSAQQPVDAVQYAATCVLLQQRYAQYNPIWEIWNEPNLPANWGATPDANAYARLAIATGKALVAAGATDVWSGGTSGIDFNFISTLIDNGVFSTLTGCAVHFYNQPCSGITAYRRLQEMLPSGVHVHTTETCVPDDQSNFFRQIWSVHRELGIPTMIWCELRDGTAGHGGSYNLPYGLLTANYTPKDVYQTAEQLTLAS